MEQCSRELMTQASLGDLDHWTRRVMRGQAILATVGYSEARQSCCPFGDRVGSIGLQ